MLAVNLLAEATNTAKNATYGSAGTAVTFYRPSLSIRQNVPCVVRSWVGEAC